MTVDDAADAFYHLSDLTLDQCFEVAELVESDIGPMINHDEVMAAMLAAYNETHVRPIRLRSWR